MYASRFIALRMININVCTIANPENTAPATKYGGKIVVCHPGITEVAKSKDTIECTENTSGVAKPARTNEINSNLFQCFALPDQPNAKIEYIFLETGFLALSLIVAKSGIKPIYQNTKPTERYVEMANTSHNRGELKFTHKEPK